MKLHVRAWSDKTELNAGQLQPGDRILGDGTDLNLAWDGADARVWVPRG